MSAQFHQLGKKKLTTEACSPEAWIHVFSVGKSSPFMALIHVSELLLFAQSYGKLMKIALSFLRWKYAC